MIGTEVQQQLQRAFEDVGVEGALHALDIDSGREVRYHAGDLQHTGSMAKIPIMVTLMQSVAAGEHRLDERVHLPASPRTLGPTGLSTMKDETNLSLRDLVHSMITVSDNHATDVVLGMVSPERVTETMRSLGLEQTTISGTAQELLDDARPLLQMPRGEQRVEAMHSAPQLVGESCPWRTTPEEMTRLLTLIWTDRAALPDLCAVMREILYAQVWRDRLSSGFPDEVKVGAKTGTIAGVRNEAGVVEYPDGGRYAVAVFNRRADWSSRDPHSDRAIGTAARIAVDALRGGNGP